MVTAESVSTPSHDVGVPWALTTAISPRARVRVASVDAAGDVLNDYVATTPLTGPAPLVPWAVTLTDPGGRYRLLAFDLDVKGDPAVAARDGDLLAGHLSAAGIEYVVCRSSSRGGRHVWVALAEPADAVLVRDVATSVANACPSLDPTPLSNPVTGCCRPPGAPHRDGSTSTVLHGDLTALTRPSTTRAQLRALATALNAAHPGVPVTDPRQPDSLVPLDETGHVYLPGARRSLPAASTAALAEHPGPETDASTLLWRVLIGAAAARWRYRDVVALLDSPGMEHARTERLHGDTRRRARAATGTRSTAAVLRHHWTRAVRHVAATPRQVGDDPTFDPRADALADIVEDVQARADAAPGRWSSGGGPADRRVLDVLCLLALQGLTADVDADTRRVALHAGIGRETARTALLRLGADGWITCTRTAEGPHGARWNIAPRPTIHNRTQQARSQAVTRPEGAGAARRGSLLTLLSSRASASRHDAFLPLGGLGLLAGNVYSRITSPPTTHDLSSIGADEAVLHITLDRLVVHGLLHRTPTEWAPTRHDRRDAVADALATAGTLAARAERYALERDVWTWWRTEQTWMTAAGRSPRRRGTSALHPALTLGQPWDVYPRYPRTAQAGRPGRRGNHRDAAAAVRAGVLAHLRSAA